jgi:hypothetical protein
MYFNILGGGKRFFRYANPGLGVYFIHPETKIEFDFIFLFFVFVSFMCQLYLVSMSAQMFYDY